jgi:hypothetical protein
VREDGRDDARVGDVERQGTADHAVTCRNGRRYRVDAGDYAMVRVTPP